jgi:biotin/methionine sulfoxide reductase
MTTTPTRRTITHMAHWGAYTATVEDGALTAVRPLAGDLEPSPIRRARDVATRHARESRNPHACWETDNAGARR